MLQIIHDNDFGRDGDGAFAYWWLHQAEDEGLCKILAVVGDADDHLREPVSGYSKTISAFLDHVRRYFGHDAVPMGLPYADDGDPWEVTRATDYLSISTLLASSEDSNDTYGNALANAEDASVTILTTGALIALARFMTTAEGETPTTWGGKTAIELITDKVVLFACGAGVFPGGSADINGTNFGCPWSADADIRAAHKAASIYVLTNWPVTVPINYYGESMTATGDFLFDAKTAPQAHPCHLLYSTFDGGIERHDVLRAAILAKGLGGMHALSASGYCTVNENGTQTWTADAVDGVPTAGHPLARYVTAEVATADSNYWLAFLAKNLPQVPLTDEHLTLAYDWTGTYNTEMSATADAIADLTGNGIHMTAYGTTRPKYLRDGIITFPAGSYLQRNITNSGPGEDGKPYSLSNVPYFVMLDVYIPDDTVEDALIFAGQSLGTAEGWNTEVWSIGISGKKWRFTKVDESPVLAQEVLSADDITEGWHRICGAARNITNGTSWDIAIFVDGVIQGTALGTAMTRGRGYLRINGGSWAGAVAANYPMANFRIYNYKNIEALDLMSKFMNQQPKVLPSHLRRGSDRGDGITGLLSVGHSF